MQAWLWGKVHVICRRRTRSRAANRLLLCSRDDAIKKEVRTCQTNTAKPKNTGSCFIMSHIRSRYLDTPEAWCRSGEPAAGLRQPHSPGATSGPKITKHLFVEENTVVTAGDWGFRASQSQPGWWNHRRSFSSEDRTWRDAGSRAEGTSSTGDQPEISRVFWDCLTFSVTPKLF